MASAIKEGFICAECHAQFNSGTVLLAHYQEAHSPDDGKSIKGLIEKARSRLVNKEKQEEVLRLPPKYYDLYEDIPPGQTKSHLDYFKRVRAAQVERYSSEASKLLIRLHKVLSFTGDESKRRNHEQELVQWVEEKHVQRCPDCTQSFNLLLRKHHCRLCGSILCEHCSTFISADLASTLTSSLGAGSLGTASTDYRLRTCQYCYKLVNKKHISSYSTPIITQFYDRLKALMKQCETLNVEYSTMVSSLARGENLYSLDQCTGVRNDLIKLTERIDNLSKKIILLGIESNEVISESEKRLRARLRLGAINWIRDFLSGLLTIPDREKEQQSLGEGWTPSRADSSAVSDSDDVIGIQIANMKKWISEAKRAKKFDEVEMLQANLTELLSFRNSS